MWRRPPRRGKAARAIGALVLALLAWPFFSPPAFLPEGAFCRGTAYAQDDWKGEFEDICSKTQDSMSFSAEQLRGLIDRADKLRKVIETLDETQRKVYLKRLQMCRDLFAFALESKETKEKRP